MQSDAVRIVHDIDSHVTRNALDNDDSLTSARSGLTSFQVVQVVQFRPAVHQLIYLQSFARKNLCAEQSEVQGLPRGRHRVR